ncbi:MAG: 2-aminoadipate transaminase [Burkholderia gladioli]|nr:MAG: 2-aminoadipate transaminase [Burkholderia gladioli]
MRATQVLITTGSQQALDLLGKTLIYPGSRVLVETPTYLGALQSFSMYEPSYVQVASDAFGLVPEALTPEVTRDARALYAQPNFQNPTGRRMLRERRRALAAFAQTSPFPVLEDDPYGALNYQGEPLPTMLSMAPDHIVHLGSFSKVLSPGVRIGYVIAPESLHFKLVQAKQATDLHTPSLTQRIAYEVIREGFLDTHIPSIRALYAAQCDAMLGSLARRMPAGVTWNRPEGGMFVWVQLPAGGYRQHGPARRRDRAKCRVRAGRAVLRRRRAVEHAAPVVRDGAARTDRGRRGPARQAAARAHRILNRLTFIHTRTHHSWQTSTTS